MACRSVKRAEAARARLLRFFDGHVAQMRGSPGDKARAEELRRNLVVDVQYLDLASMKTVLDFAGVIKQKYPYVSHLACNAGVASFDRIDWVKAMKQLVRSPTETATTPKFYTQHTGELSVDGFGWVWQCNVFGHFALFRELEAHLAASPLGGRVIWCSSLEASPAHFDAQDWQLRRTARSYEGAKYEIDLIATALDRRGLGARAENTRAVRHLVSQPGVSHTRVAAAMVHPVADFLKLLMFYLVRFLGSPHHPIDPVKGAVAAVHLALVPLAFLAHFSQASAPPVRYGAETDRWGNERVGISPVQAWLKHQDDARALVEQCDQLLDQVRREQGRPHEFETASEKM